MGNQLWLGLLITLIITGIGLLIKKAFDLQGEVGELRGGSGHLHLGNPIKMDLGMLIIVVYSWTVAVFIIWISSQFTLLHPLRLFVYAEAAALIWWVCSKSSIPEALRRLLTSLVYSVGQRRVLVSGFAFWAVITLVYGSVLDLLGFDPASYYYHLLLLLFPATLLLKRRETLRSIGFVFTRETLAEQASWVLPFFVGSVLGIYVRAQLLGRPLDIHMSVSWVFFLDVVILIPFVEETFFRGFLQTQLQPVVGRDRALLIASAAYALTHVPGVILAQEYLFPSYVPEILLKYPLVFLPQFFVFGAILGRIYQRTRSIWCPMVIHSLINAVLYTFIIPA